MIKADQEVDARYEYLRTKHGDKNPQANGYRLNSFFLREQRVLLSEIDFDNGPFLDIACGSGLMLEPLINQGKEVYGLDFNEDACVSAKLNKIKIIRGDAFSMPLAENSIGQIVNCQFLNQQSTDQTQKFIEESARVLKKDGQLIILWRNARSLMHMSAHTAFTLIDKVTGQPPFPQFTHPIKEIERLAKNAGFQVVKKSVTLPFLKPDMLSPVNPLSYIIGASNFIVLKKI